MKIPFDSKIQVFLVGFDALWFWHVLQMFFYYHQTRLPQQSRGHIGNEGFWVGKWRKNVILQQKWTAQSLKLQ